MLTRVLLLLCLVITSPVFAAGSMRDCAILPITDSAGDSLGRKIFDRIEENIKSTGWCRYRSSSDVLGILSKYRQNLRTHLENRRVLQTVATRLNVGSLIKVILEYNVDQVSVELKVIAANGEDIYFQEKTTLNKIEEDQVYRKVITWLDIYQKSIPYDGLVLGVLGEQVTFTTHKNKIINQGQEFEIRRFVDKRKHPLLKKIVEWDSILLAKGKIQNLSDRQLLGVVKVYTSEKKIKKGDWVVIKKPMPELGYPEKKLFKSFEKGRLGELYLDLGLSTTNISTSPSSGSVKFGGYTYGVGVETEAWVT